jgi:hypothetical protein
MRRKWAAIALLVGISAASGLAYALTNASLAEQLSKNFEGQMPLLLTVGALVLLIASAVIALVYGFRMEGKMGRPEKRRDSNR